MRTDGSGKALIFRYLGLILDPNKWRLGRARKCRRQRRRLAGCLRMAKEIRFCGKEKVQSFIGSRVFFHGCGDLPEIDEQRAIYQKISDELKAGNGRRFCLGGLGKFA